MSIVLFDTETTGRDPRSARIVQIAAYLMEATPPFRFISELNVIVRPQGFTVPPETTAIHGITHAEAMRRGIPLPDALDKFNTILEAAHENMSAGRLVAHNFNYDNIVVMSEYARMGRDIAFLASFKPMCTMLSMQARCALPGRYGKPKWPKLHEAYMHCFNQLPDEDERGYRAHSAMGDVLSVRDIFIHGYHEGWWE